MFTTNHFIWLAVCAVYLAALIALMIKFRPSQKLVLTIACVIGPLFSLAMPTVFESTDVSRAFTEVMPYQYFLYHTSLIALGIYIAKSGMVKFCAKHILTSVALMFVLTYVAIYANSALASVDYSSGSAVIESVTNFFFVYGLPIDLFTITEKWAVAAVLLLPVPARHRDFHAGVSAVYIEKQEGKIAERLIIFTLFRGFCNSKTA